MLICQKRFKEKGFSHTWTFKICETKYEVLHFWENMKIV